MNPGPFFLLGFLMLATVLIACTMALRYKRRELEHRERMFEIEKGVALPVTGNLLLHERPVDLMLRGRIWLYSGIGIIVFLLAVSISSQREDPAWVRVENANKARNEGATEAQLQEIMNDKGRSVPPGLALIGLIPIGVGLAYLTTYRKETARMRE